jgi:hypothetical protein
VFKSPKHTDVTRAGARSKARVAVLLASGALVLGALLVAIAPARPWDATGQLPIRDAAPLAAGAKQQIATSLARLPLAFAPAAAGEGMDFLARGAGYGIALSPTALTLELRGADAPVAMRFLNTKAGSPGIGEAKLPGTLNYFIGNDPSLWRTEIPTFGAVRYRDLYAGIDLLHYGAASGELEHDLVVAPGADPGQIGFSIEGTQTQVLESSGELVLGISAGELRLRRPLIYQESAAGRTLVAGGYQSDGARVGFWLGAYDLTLPLIIDPTLAWSTYLGGTGTDSAYAMALDSSGNAYIAGDTDSTNFPKLTPFQAARSGASDAFVSKLNAAGTALLYSTYLGGTTTETAYGIAVDAAGSAYVTGRTNSANFPTTAGAYQVTYGGAPNDAFVTKLSAAGSTLAFSTYIGKSGDDQGFGIAVDAGGNVYVAGYTIASNFATTAGAFQIVIGGSVDLFVTKFNPAGSALIYSTFLGGAGSDLPYSIAVDSSGNAYVSGYTGSSNFPATGGAYQVSLGGSIDAFVTKLNSTGTALVYSTYVGGTTAERGYAIAIDSGGNAYLTGPTDSTNFPTTAGAYQTTYGGSADAFVTKLNPAGSALVYSTYLGGSGTEDGRGIAVDSSGNAYITGNTSSTNFPVTNAYQGTSGGAQDAFVTKLNPAGSALVYSTYLGGTASDQGQAIAVDAAGLAYVAGYTTSTNFPSVAPFQASNAGGQDAFVIKFAPNPTVSAIAPIGGALAGGTTVTITGTAFVSGATVTIGGSPATGVVFVSATSLTAISPAHAAGPVNVVVTNPDTLGGTGTNLYTYANAATISAVAPTGGPLAGGTAITITGTGFVAGATVTLGGTAATSVVVASATSITATAPAHAGGVVNIVVTTPDTQTGTGTSLYSYAAAPTVSAIAPTSGSTAGGTTVTITGTGFATGATVTIGGSAATGVTFVNATSLTATTAAHAAGLTSVVVTNPDTQAGTGTSLFTFIAPPTVSAIAPTGGSIGGGTAITITGTGFVSGATVALGGSAATGVVFVSATSLTATTAAHAAGVVSVVVTNPDTQTGTGTNLFTYAPAPVVSAIAPIGGPLAGGTAVTITGTGFVTGATVTIGGTTPTGISWVNATTITATTVAHAAGAVNVVVTNPDAQAVTAAGLFTYASAPTVATSSPASGPTTGSSAITITGTGFAAGATVSIGGTAATGVGVTNATTITATTPAHAAGGATVVVINPDTQSGGCSCFTFVAPPTVSAVSPTGGSIGGGTAITITGAGFVSGATVSIGGSAATSVLFGSATSLTATTPAHAAGAVNVIVTNPDTQTGTGTGLFTYASAPTVSATSPVGGPLAGGTAVTITGTGFVTGATLTIGGSAATGVAFVSPTSITATAPAHAAGAVNVVVTNPDTQTGTGTGLFTYASAPTVSAVAPTSGALAGGTSVTITGTGFVGGATITIGGSAATGVAFNSATSITAITPAHAAGAVNVVVTNPDTQTGSGLSLYTYAPAPSVSGISPTGGALGGGTAVAITGADFVSGASVTIGGSPATSVAFVSATSLTAMTPAHAAGVVNVAVANPDTQTGTGAGLYTYAAAPVVSAISPIGGPMAGGTTVTITGTGFVSGATVSLGGSAASGVTFVNSTSLTANTPAHAAGAVNVVVTNPDAQIGTGTSLFSYANAPSISAISPIGGALAGNTAVTITGTGFVNGVTVSIGGSAATGVTFISSSSLTATTPAHAAGVVNVVVTNPDTQAGTGTSLFTYANAPTVSAISPTGGPLAGGTSVTITGTGFSSGASVTLGGASATSVTVVSATSITATTPAHAAGVISVVVTNPDTQIGTGSGLFTYANGPTISAISPTGGALAGGTAVTISGSGFVAGATVSIGGSPATGVAFVSATSLTATTPTHAAGAVDIVVANPDGQTGTGTGLYTYAPAPSVSTISPTGGALAGGTAVTITGTGFLGGATLTIGGSAASNVAFVSATSLTATTPAHAAGVVDVVVTNPDAQFGTGPSLYTYAAAPSVSAIAPTAGALAGGTAVTITGTDFTTGASVTIGGSPATGVTFVSASSLTATTPAHAAGVVNVVVTNPDAQFGTGPSLYTYAAAPSVSVIAPTFGPTSGATPVVISGTGFVAGASVTMGGTSATGITVVNATTITATAPAHTSGAMSVTVTNADTQFGSCSGCFTYVGPPTVSGMSPSSGPTAGGSSITISGNGFIAGSSVTLGGASATGVSVVNATTITATSPAHAVGAVDVVVTSPDTQFGSCVGCFTFIAPPTVSSVAPISGPIGGGTNVTITGTAFVSGASVSIGGSAATSVVFVNATTITATTPAHAAGVAAVAVANPDTQTGSCSCFTFDPPPTISGISPASGPTAGGTSVTITGIGFVAGATVTIGGASATGVTVVSAITIIATAPAHAAGVVNVVVTNADAQAGTCLGCFTFIAAPAVSGVSPSSAPTAGGTSVTITGTAFVSGATVTLGGTAATSVVIVTATTITATTPAHPAGSVNVVVTNADTQSGSCVACFGFVAPPAISGISPNSGPTSGGTSVTITGMSFAGGAAVAFGGVAPTSSTVVNATTITATTPAHATGAVTVTVTNPDAQTDSCSTCFTFLLPPTLSGISPSSGPTAGGTAVNITGTDFISGATVTIGGSVATSIVVVNATTITATSPTHAAGPTDVIVTNPDSQSSSCSCFIFVAPPSVSGISPTFGLPAGGTSVTITGTDFVSGATLTIGASAATGITVVSDTTITATTAADAAGTVTVIVTNPDMQSGSCVNCYTYGTPPPAPTVGGISPISGSTSGGTSVTITGTGFVGGATVTIGGSAASSITIASATTITATTAGNTAGLASVVVTNPDTQSGTGLDLFTYLVPVSPPPGFGGGGSTPSTSRCEPVEGTVVRTCILIIPGARIEIPAETRVRTAEGSVFRGAVIAPLVAQLAPAPGVAVTITVGSADGTPFTLSQPALLTLDLPSGRSAQDVQPFSVDQAGVRTYFSKANSPRPAAGLANPLSVGMLISSGGTYGLVIIPDIEPVTIAPLTQAINPGRHARIVAESVWPTLEPNQIATLIVRLQNTGDMPWIRDVQTSELRLGASAPLDNTRDTDSGLLEDPLGGMKNRYARQTEELVAPGGIATMKLQVRAPASGETRRIDMRPVVDGVSWLEDEGLFLIVNSGLTEPALFTP